MRCADPPLSKGVGAPQQCTRINEKRKWLGGVVTGRQSGRTSTRLCTLDDVIPILQPRIECVSMHEGCTRNLEATKDRWDREEEDTDGLYAEPCDGVRQLGTPSGSSQKLMKCRWECISYRVVSYHAPRPQHGYGNGTGCLYTLFLSP